MNKPYEQWTVAAESGEWFPVKDDYSPIEPTMENANMMSAAPDMLTWGKAILKYLPQEVATISGEPSSVDRFRASLAKAEGFLAKVL